MIKLIIAYVLIFFAGIIFAILCRKMKNDEPAKSGTIIIRKNEEAIDGQVQFTKDLWDISTYKEVLFKVKIISGEPGDWEENKNG